MNKIIEKFAVSFAIVFGVLLIFASFVIGFGELAENIHRHFGKPGTVVFILFIISLIFSTLWTFVE